MLRKSFTSAMLFVAFIATALAQAPADYYTSAKGQTGAGLKTALCKVIASHTTLSYSSIWEHVRKTDVRPDGKVWDMYSAVTNYTFGTDQAGNYSKEGDVYNREHSFPKSWFDEKSPMNTDLMHLVPTDGYVNGRRSNYPFGETDSPTWSSAQGWSKLGPCSTSGYSGTVFEPNDEYKGDFARIYFYMATAYEEQFPSFSSPMLAGNKYPCYKEWALTMLLRWAKEDPVSQKEIDRNNAVYSIQKNRNPYVDFPGLEEYVWGSKTSTPFNPNDYNGSTPVDPAPNAPSAPTFSIAGGMVAQGTVVTIDCTTAGAQIYYSINGEEEVVATPPAEITIDEDMTITARSVVDGKTSESVTQTYTVKAATEVSGNTYVKVTAAEDLKVGANYIIVCEKYGTALGSIGGNTSKDIRNSVSVTINADGTISTETGSCDYPYHLVLGGKADAYTLYDPSSSVYLSYTGSKNKLFGATSASANSEQWKITFNNGYAHISPLSSTGRRIQYNVSAPRFVCYTGTQQEVCLYKQESSTAIENIQSGSKTANIYSTDGRLVRQNADITSGTKHLPKGVYIIDGKKIVVR